MNAHVYDIKCSNGVNEAYHCGLPVTLVLLVVVSAVAMAVLRFSVNLPS